MANPIQMVDKEELISFLNTLDGREDLDWTQFESEMEQYLAESELTEIVHCRDCNTFTTKGMEDGYGWCKKFCFGPPLDGFCMLGELTEPEQEELDDKQQAEEELNVTK